MLSSPNHGEVANAAAQLCKFDIHRIAELIEDSGDSEGHSGANFSSLVSETLKRRVEQLSRENDSLRRMVEDQLKCCAFCGEEFIARRADAHTCSPKCRTALRRKHARKAA
jgi:hypothetical protein